MNILIFVKSEYIAYTTLTAYQTAIICLLAAAFAAIFFTAFFRVKLVRELKERNKVLSVLINSAPCSVIRCLNDDNLTIKYCNRSFLNQFGEESARQLISVIDKEDLFITKRALRQQLENENEFEVNFRAKKTDNSIVWLHCRGSKFIDNMVEHLYCVLLDISGTVLMERQQKIDQERYRIVAEASDSVIFEFNLGDKTVFCTNKFLSKFGYMPVERQMPRALYYFKFVHPDDIFKFKAMYNSFYNGSSGGSEELRLKKLDGSYIWCEMRYSTIFDERGLPIRAVGKIIDIDKAKRERETLIRANQVDAFTGLYNKKWTFSLITAALKEAPSKKHALMFIDIDHFKRINDKFGHNCGDKLLLRISESIKKCFRASDITGRIGGDEFLVFVRDYEDIEKLTALVNSFCRDIKSIKEESCAAVTVSIGIALYPEDSRDVTELYINSDKALYKAKNTGRNAYMFFGEKPSVSNYNDKKDIDGEKLI